MRSKISLFIIIVVVALSLTQLAISYYLASLQEYSAFLEKKTESLEKEINELAVEIAKLGSLSVIAAKAKDLGMEKSQKIVTISSEVPVALNQ